MCKLILCVKVGFRHQQKDSASVFIQNCYVGIFSMGVDRWSLDIFPSSALKF